MPKIIDYDEKKRQIAEAALGVFVKRGYYNTKLLDISKNCGMGRTTLYQYFKNKDEIFCYAMEYAIYKLKDMMENIVEDEDLSFFDKIKMIILELMKEYEHNGILIVLIELWLILKREKKVIAENIDKHAVELRKIFEYLINEGIKAEEFKPFIDSKSMSNTLYALIIQMSLIKDINIKKQQATINILLDGLRV